MILIANWLVVAECMRVTMVYVFLNKSTHHSDTSLSSQKGVDPFPNS